MSGERDGGDAGIRPEQAHAAIRPEQAHAAIRPEQAHAAIRPEQAHAGIRPEQAVEAAREAAERKRAAGAYPSDTIADAGKPAGPDLARLREWAIVEVDPELLYSTRKGGAPITWLKRMLLRLLRQYTTELEAQQTRFNVGVVAYLESLEKHDSE